VSSPGQHREPPIRATPAGRAAVVAAVTAALLPVVAPVAEAATISPSDPGMFNRADLRAMMLARANRASRPGRDLYPPAPRHPAAVAVQVAVEPPPTAPPVQVTTYHARHQAPPRRVPKPRNAGTRYAPPPVTESANVMVRFAYGQVGKRYVFGASGPSAWDCSGLTAAAARLVGVSLPHNADAQRHYGRAVSRAELQPGDLIFYGGHAAIFVGGNMMIAAANVREGVVLQRIYGTPVAYRRLV
jgi:cell wall-associated NlpC family hydrolase